MHITDVHAQLLPVHYREPAVNIGVHGARNRPPHLVGEALLRAFFDRARLACTAHALSHLDYVAAAAAVRSRGRLFPPCHADQKAAGGSARCLAARWR